MSKFLSPVYFNSGLNKREKSKQYVLLLDIIFNFAFNGMLYVVACENGCREIPSVSNHIVKCVGH